MENFNKKAFLDELRQVIISWLKDGNKPLLNYEDDDKWDTFIEYAKKQLKIDKDKEPLQDKKIDTIIDSTVNLFPKVMAKNPNLKNISEKLKKRLKGQKSIKKEDLFKTIREEVLNEISLDPEKLKDAGKELENIEKTIGKIRTKK